MASIRVLVVLGLFGCVASYTGHENCDTKGGSHQHAGSSGSNHGSSQGSSHGTSWHGQSSLFARGSGGSRSGPRSRSAATANTPPRYRGCFYEDLPGMLRAFYTTSQFMTRELCFDICRSRFHLYAAVGRGYACSCDDAYDPIANYQVPESQCDLQCSGNFRETCGGEGRVNFFQLR